MGVRSCVNRIFHIVRASRDALFYLLTLYENTERAAFVGFNKDFINNCCFYRSKRLLLGYGSTKCDIERGDMSKMGIAGNMTLRRKALRLTQKELANKVSSSQSYINEIEKGRKNPSMDKIKAIAEALGYTVSQLISEGE